MRRRLRKSENPPLRQRRRETGENLPATASFSYGSHRKRQDVSINRQTNRPAEVKPKGRWASSRYWLERSGLIILSLAVVVSLVNILSLSDNAIIMPFTNSDKLSPQLTYEYQQAANHILASSIWNGNKLTIDENNLSSQLLSKYPGLVSVSVTIPLVAHRPIIYVQPAQPALVLTSVNGAFVLDDQGKVISQLSASSSAGSLPEVIDQSSLQPKLNQQVLPQSYISFIQEVVAQLAAKNFHVQSMTLPASASELDVHLVGQPYYIKFNLEENNARQQTGTFLATIAYLQGQHITPGQYVDVRVDGRAYYQ